MNVLGMGPLELLLILVLALIVFGPARLPEIMGQVGRAIADFRRATSQLSDEFNRTIQSELAETKQVVEETRAALSDARSTVTSAHAAVTSAVTTLPAPQRVAVPAGAEPAPVLNGTSAEPHIEPNGSTSTSAVPASAPPLADTSGGSWESAYAPAASLPPSAPAAAPAAPASPTAPSARSARERGPLRDELLPPY